MSGPDFPRELFDDAVLMLGGGIDYVSDDRKPTVRIQRRPPRLDFGQGTNTVAIKLVDGELRSTARTDEDHALVARMSTLIRESIEHLRRPDLSRVEPMRATTAPPFPGAFADPAYLGRRAPVIEEVIEDAARVAATMRYLAAIEPAANLRLGDDSVRGQMTRDGAILVDLTRAATLAPPLELELHAPHAVFVARWNGGFAPDRLPDRLIRRRWRSERRVAAPPRLMARFASGSLAVDCPVANVSLRGMALELPAGSTPPHPGTRLEPLEVHWKGGARSLHVAAEVVRVDVLAAGRLRCGINLLRADALGEWRAAVAHLLYPRTSVGTATAESLWELYERSGYFGLSNKRPADFGPLYDAFARAQDRLTRAPALGAMVCRSSSSRLECVSLHLEVWEGSWMTAQFCRRGDDRPLDAADDAALNDLYVHLYEYPKQVPGARWTLAYIQDSTRFSKRVNLDLAARHVSSGRACVRPFRALEIACDAELPAPSRGVACRPATATEISELRGQLERDLPAPYLSATGLDRPGLDIGPLGPRWRAAGLLRDRAVLVCSENGVLRAAAVLDSGEEGMHLFGLLDLVRLFSLSSAGTRFYPQLLAAARDWYRAQQKSRFVYFDEETGADHLVGVPCRDLGTAHYVILSTELVPELLEHLEMVTIGAG